MIKCSNMNGQTAENKLLWYFDPQMGYLNHRFFFPRLRNIMKENIEVFKNQRLGGLCLLDMTGNLIHELPTAG